MGMYSPMCDIWSLGILLFIWCVATRCMPKTLYELLQALTICPALPNLPRAPLPPPAPCVSLPLSLTGKIPFTPKPTFEAQLEEIKANKFSADVPELKDIDERAKVRACT